MAEQAAPPERSACTVAVEEALKLWNAGQSETAFAVATSVLENGHACISWERAAHLVAGIQLEWGKVDDLLVLAPEVVKAHPACPYGWFQLGQAHELCHSWNEAASAFLRSVQLQSGASGGATEPTMVHVHLTHAAVQAGRRDLVDPFLDQWDAKPPEQLEGRRCLAMCLLEVDRTEDAERILLDLLASTQVEQRAPVLHELGLAMLSRERLNEALAYFLQSAKGDADDAHQSQIMLAIVESRLGHHLEAATWARRALNARPTDLSYRVKLAFVLLHGNEVQLAIQEYQSILSSAPNLHEVRCGLALALLRAERSTDAVEELRALEREGWTWLPLSATLGVALAQRRDPGDLEEALSRHQRLLGLKWPPDEEAIIVTNTIYLCVLLGDRVQAEHLASKSYVDWPQELQTELAQVRQQLAREQRGLLFNEVLRVFGEKPLAALLASIVHQPSGGESLPQHEGADSRDEEMSEATSRLMAVGTLLANGENLRGLSGGSRQRSGGADPAPPEEVDIAIITVLPEEYAAVRQRLQNPQLAPGLPERPNSYAWETAMLPSRIGDYRVVLAMAGRPGNVSGALVTAETVERWHPRYVIMVGIAGGLARGIALGDVVVSTTIYGYEYGKLLAHKFQPRTAFVYATDGALVNSSKRMALMGDGWRSSLSPQSEPFTPKILHGEVASGEKVVDNRNAILFRQILQAWPNLAAVEMEGAGAAGAIEALSSRQTIGFAMVRGISDIPPGRSESGEVADAGIVQSGQRDKSKVIASDTAAAFVIHWITQGWPVLPKVRKD